MAVAFLAIGTLISSFTDNVVVAYVGTLFALLVLYTIGWLGETVQGFWGSVVRYISITDHFQELTKGVIDTKDLVYFATILIVSALPDASLGRIGPLEVGRAEVGLHLRPSRPALPRVRLRRDGVRDVAVRPTPTSC